MMKFENLQPGMVIEVFDGNRKIDEGVFAGMSACDNLLIKHQDGSTRGYGRYGELTYKKVDNPPPVRESIYGWDFVRES